MSEVDPKVQQTIDLLNERITHCSSEEEAIEKAKANPVKLSKEAQQVLDDAVFHETGCRPASFYLPENLLKRLEALDDRDIDPSFLIESTLEMVLQTIETVLAQQDQKKADQVAEPPLQKTGS